MSNLLQELTLRAEDGHKVAVISTSILCESPLHRIRRQIRDRFWDDLTRRLDADVIEQVIKDSKVVSRSGIPTIYVPRAARAQLIYYSKVAEQLLELKLQVVEMPRHITTETYKSMLASPGILALDTHTYLDEGGHLQTVVVPFVVPSSRFNEFFGWDSYFMGIGLLADNRTDLVQGILRNWIFEINHYGIIPTRTDPTFCYGHSRLSSPTSQSGSTKLPSTKTRTTRKLSSKCALKLPSKSTMKSGLASLG